MNEVEGVIFEFSKQRLYSFDHFTNITGNYLNNF